MSADDYKLNSNQHAAIKYISGPLLIVAGAGTGKTTTLVEKIKYLITKKKVRPEEVLCLTFTEKAAFEMEERVDKALPYGFFQMWISTFHSFADEILKREVNHIGLNPAYSLMTKAQTILFFKNNLFEFDLKYFRPLSNPTKFIEGLLQHFSRLHDEDISPEEYIKWTTKSAYAKATPDKEEKEKMIELGKSYAKFQELKIKHDVLDFDDLIFYLLKLFRKRPHILKQYQKQFKHVMVDEFQDTNIAQYELIKLLCPKKSKPKLTVVGDDSQAIYKFRGASVSNILSFMHDYPNAKQVTLVDNYRSNQTILDHAYKLIKNNDPDTLEAKLGISKELKSHKKNIKEAVELTLFENGDSEAQWVAKKIQDLIKTQKYEFRDFAILVRANNHSELFVNTFLRNGIPYQFLGPGTLFKQPEVRDLIAYLKVITNLEDNVALYRLLSLDIFNIDPADIILLIGFSKKTTLPLFQGIEIYLSFFYQELYSNGNLIYKKYLPLLKETSREKLYEFLLMIKRHLLRLKKDTSPELLYYFLEDSGLLKKATQIATEADEKRILNITKFLNLLKHLHDTEIHFDVFKAVDYITMSQELGESPLALDTDVALANAVNILTVHSAKGLEFPVVFLPNLVSGRFPTYMRREQIPIPDELIKEQLPQGDYHLEEERRLFYVGMTRAMDHTYISASKYYGDGRRQRKVSPFVIETLGQEAVEKQDSLRSTLENQLSIFDFKKIEAIESKPVLKLSQFSYSQLEIYEVCPLQYKFQYIFKIPTPPAAAASFGSSIHKVLQEFYEGFINDRSWGLDEILKLLETHWDPGGYESKSAETYAKRQAKEMLTKYIEKIHKNDVVIKNLEKLFKIKIDDKTYLTGKIDRVDEKGNGVIEIIDYKTGNRPDDRILQKSLQLSIYALAATNKGLYDKPLSQVELTFYYLQTMEKVTLKRTKEDLDKVRLRINAAITNMRAGKFAPRVGLHCKYCAFLMICEAGSNYVART